MRTVDTMSSPRGGKASAGSGYADALRPAPATDALAVSSAWDALAVGAAQHALAIGGAHDALAVGAAPDALAVDGRESGTAPGPGPLTGYADGTLPPESAVRRPARRTAPAPTATGTAPGAGTPADIPARPPSPRRRSAVARAAPPASVRARSARPWTGSATPAPTRRLDAALPAATPTRRASGVARTGRPGGTGYRDPYGQERGLQALLRLTAEIRRALRDSEWPPGPRP